jgi:antirestriction protein ArdC
LPQAENLLRKSGANIIEKGQNAFFSPSTDEVWLPERHLFADAANFYAIPACMSWFTGVGAKNA